MSKNEVKYKYDKTDWLIAIFGAIGIFLGIVVIAIGLEGGDIERINIWYCLGVAISLSVVRELCKWHELSEWLNDK